MADVIAPADEPKPDPEKNNDKIKQEFKENKKDFEKPPEPPGNQSQQVANQQHGLDGGPKPPGSTRAAVDRQTHNQAMANDNKAAQNANADRAKLAAQNARQYKEQYEKAAGQEQQNSQDRGTGR